MKRRAKGGKPFRKPGKKMTKRYIILLPDIPIMNLEGDKPYYVDKDGKSQPLSHRKYIKGRCTDAAFTLKGFSGSCKAAAIIAAVENLNPGDVLALDQDDWELLKESVEHPRVQSPDGRVVDVGFDPIAGPQIVPFGRAILDAKLEDPRKVEEPTSEVQ